MSDPRPFPTLAAAPPRAAAAAAAALARALAQAIDARGHATFAASGGNTPRHVLPRLAAHALDWAKVCVTLVDERWVAPGHPDSNEGLVRETLLHGPAAAARLVGLKTADDDAATGQAACERALAGVSFPLDVAYLGFGPDGHVASLFPDAHARWRAAPGRCVAIPETPARQARMSLTPAALLDCRRFVIVYEGAEKHAVFSEAQKPGPVEDLPLRLVVRQDRVPLEVFRVAD